MRVLIASFAASTLPTGISLILCVFITDGLKKMTGLEVYLAYAGLSLVLMTILILSEEMKRIKGYHHKPPPPNSEPNSDQLGEISPT